MRKVVYFMLIMLILLIAGCDGGDRRNGYMLDKDSSVLVFQGENPLYTHGYDWWWHSFVAVDRETGEAQPFFIEYYVINPGLGGSKPVLGQLPENQAQGIKPSYAMIKAGAWVKDNSVQINNFYAIDDFSASIERMDVRIGDNIATDTKLIGSASLTQEEVEQHPEYMSEAGTMSWDLDVEKVLSYSVGYAASELFVSLNSFQMWWHVPGMKTRYSGTVTFNDRVFDVIPERSYGYQDKNWGSDYTNPWIWLNCNNFTSQTTGEPLDLTSLAVGGGNPVVFNQPLGRKALVAFYHEGRLYEYNFSKFWEYSDLKFEVDIGQDKLTWNVVAEDAFSRIEIEFSNPRNKMLKINYENPAGEWNHRELWNGHHASGTVTLYHKTLAGLERIDVFEGSLGGSEYGFY